MHRLPTLAMSGECPFPFRSSNLVGGVALGDLPELSMWEERDEDRWGGILKTILLMRAGGEFALIEYYGMDTALWQDDQSVDKLAARAEWHKMAISPPPRVKIDSQKIVDRLRSSARRIRVAGSIRFWMYAGDNHPRWWAVR
jgi:hypothetical protein